MQEIETQSKADGGITINKLIPLVDHVDRSVKQLPNDTNPKVIKLLQGSADAYNLAVDYWRCDQELSLSPAKYQCKDAVLQDITAQFPLLKKNLDHQLAEQKNPPPHLSLLFKNSQMFTLLLMQAEVNRIDAQTILAQSTIKSAFIPHPSLFWLGSGVVLCLLELFLPKAFTSKFRLVPLSMGTVALILAFLLFRFRTLRFVIFHGQIIYWMILSTALIIWIRPMLLKRKTFKVPEATEARTLTEILPGETGRVLYEGSSWAARCQERQMSIAANQTVYVVGQEDNTLIVLPEDLFRS